MKINPLPLIVFSIILCLLSINPKIAHLEGIILLCFGISLFAFGLSVIDFKKK